MGLSRPAKIKILLAIDSVFFLVELIVGYAVGSLALVADSFHMLNDVLSLVVALYAIKLSASGASAKYSYGWHRAEILSALINGVTPEISNPKLVVIVGSLGLASNILGLFLFHEHSHDHSEEKTHGKSSAPAVIESTHAAKPAGLTPTESTPLLIPSPSGSSSEASTPRGRSNSTTSLYGHPAHTRAALVAAGQEAQRTQAKPVRQRIKTEDDGMVRSAPVSGAFAASRGISSRLEQGLGKAASDEIQNVAANVEVIVHQPSPPDDDQCEEPMGDTEGPHAHHHPVTPYQNEEHHDHDHNDGHDHGKSKSHEHGHGHGHGHSHGSMNMRALVLHVLGDALGNVGVIATGLIIWLSNWPGKYYCDPVISLVITAIIFSSALPLVKSTSSILLQAVPPSLSLPHLRRALCKVEGVLAVHELHVWQLSEVKSVASVHVRVGNPMEFMAVAARVRGILHAFGVHSSTIQPEYLESPSAVPSVHAGSSGENETDGGEGCLVPCAVPGQKGCAPEDGCCPPASRPRTP
ncbi:cation efflux family protein [Ceratobasidium sp. AG-Ba]|nr:cation efflux family protein [Ceratobasidium sp. AG-Ba]